jgi:predicted glycosyltransferase
MYSKEPEKIMNILGNKGIEFINKLRSNAISKLLKYSKEPEKIKELIRNYRPDVQLEIIDQMFN